MVAPLYSIFDSSTFGGYFAVFFDNSVPLDLLSNKRTLTYIFMNTENSKKLKKPKAWKRTQPITPAQLKQMCDGFWDTAPHYGGQKGLLNCYFF
jgi:hypothetical protein